MPIPLHIRRRPARYPAWIKDRRDTLAAFERLTGKGLSERQAASALGLSPAGIQALQTSLDELAGEGTRLQGRNEAERQDLGLARLVPPNVRRPRATAKTERLRADDLAAERAGGIRRAWRWVRRWRVPYQRRAPTLPIAMV